LTEMARRSMPGPKRVRAYFMLTVFIALLAVGVRSANMFVLQPVCKICRWGVPYAGLAERIRADGFREGTIVSSNVELAGNLRRFFPASRIIVPRFITARPVPGEPLLFIGDGRYGRRADAWMVPYLPAGTDAGDLKPEAEHVPWHHLWRPTGYHYSDWWLVRAPAVPGGPK